MISKQEEPLLKTCLYDPPSGWKYGFPKVYLPKPGESIRATLLRDGYPESEFDENGEPHWVRFIGECQSGHTGAR